MREEPQILARWYDFLRYLSPQVAKFPRSERYLLGERLEQASFDVLELLLESVYAANKIERLMKANIRHFTIHDPKTRVISAAPYRDRVVHHALHKVLEPIFDPTFIHDSYATRKGKGTHAAIDRFQSFSRKNRYVLKCDIRQYFPSIDHEMLRGLIERKVACPDTLRLIDQVINSHEAATIPGGRKGIPIGNLTSQFFANVYLNGLDHFIKQTLACRYYLRYMDDFVVFHREKSFLWWVKEKIVGYLEGLRLALHEGKCRIFKTVQGVPFLGMTIFPDKRRLKKQNVIRFQRRMRRFQDRYGKGLVSSEHVHRSIQSWIGHAKQANTGQLRQVLFAEIVFRRERGD